jgi:periplasmic protein TonB
MTTVPSPFGELLPDAPEPSTSPNARFLAGAVPHGRRERGRFGNSIIGSACTHIGGCLLVLFIVDRMPVTPPSTDLVDDKASDMVWLNVSGPGRRGADAGDGKPEAARKAESARPETRPAATPWLAHEPPEDVPKPDTVINIPTVNISTGVVDLPGALTGLSTGRSQGRDMGPGAGMGTGPRGSGFGTGEGDGTGNDAFGPGNGVTMPSVLSEVKPSYTAEAMRAKVQGAVVVEAIVREDGRVGQVRIIRSLDRTFGLDEEALKAIKNWRFSPGKRQGKNVAVIVEIELTFTLR